jgi:tetratricopeptide (TPR) repeat protein
MYRAKFALYIMLRREGMKDIHLTEDDFRRLLSGEDEPRNRLVLHHLAICPACYTVAGHILDLHIAGEIDDRLCTVDIDLGKSRRHAPALFEELRRFPLPEQRAMIRDQEFLHSWGLAELLCAESEKEAPRDADRAWELADLAVQISSLIDEWEPAEPLWRDQLHAYALAHLGNACRVAGDFRAAEEAFTSAEALWQPAYENMGDVLGYEARYFALFASLRRAQRRLPDALELLDRARAASPDSLLLARILINQAKTLEELGDITAAIQVLEEARFQAGEAVDPRLRLCLVQNHLDYLSKAGQLVEAEALVSDVEALGRESGSEIDLLRLRWTQARIAKGLGRTNEALCLFEETRGGFARHDLPYDVALVALELALAYHSVGQAEEVLRVIRDTLPILQIVSVEREGLMAVRLLTDAVADRCLTAELLGNVLNYLRSSDQDHFSTLVP